MSLSRSWAGLWMPLQMKQGVIMSGRGGAGDRRQSCAWLAGSLPPVTLCGWDSPLAVPLARDCARAGKLRPS